MSCKKFDEWMEVRDAELHQELFGLGTAAGALGNVAGKALGGAARMGGRALGGAARLGGKALGGAMRGARDTAIGAGRMAAAAPSHAMAATHAARKGSLDAQKWLADRATDIEGMVDPDSAAARKQALQDKYDKTNLAKISDRHSGTTAGSSVYDYYKNRGHMKKDALANAYQGDQSSGDIAAAMAGADSNRIPPIRRKAPRRGAAMNPMAAGIAAGNMR